MPRFDNEGLDPRQRINNDTRDRSVPEDENYYSSGSFNAGTGRSNFRPVEPPRRPPVNQGGGFNPTVRDDYMRKQRQREAFTPQNEAQPRTYAQTYQSSVRDDYMRAHGMREAERASRQQAARKKKRARKKAIAAVISLVLIIALIATPLGMINAVLGKINYDEKKPNTYVSAAELKSDPQVKNILLLGVDARPKQETEQSHPDTMLLITVDKRHKCIKMTSFLRDTWVYLASRDKEQRLNTANQGVGYCGIVHSIEYLFKIDIDGYVVTDFKMFRKMVNSIGGVTITVTKAEAKEINNHPGRYGNVKIKAGTHRLNGKQALAYARIRKIDTDFKRTERQRTVIKSILSEVKSSPLKLYKLANSAAPFLETDLSKGELKKIARYVIPCLGGGMPQERVPFEGTWEYANVGGASVIKINVEKNTELLQDYIYNKTAEELKEEETTK